jgi:hypothetical protein
MAYILRQSCGTGCPQSCGGGTPEIGTITCVSRQGNGSLGGYRKFANNNAGDANLRRFTRLSYDFGAIITQYRYSGGTPCSGSSCANSIAGARPTLIDPATASVTQVGQYTGCGGVPPSCACNDLNYSGGTGYPYVSSPFPYEGFSPQVDVHDYALEFTSNYGGASCFLSSFVYYSRPSTSGLKAWFRLDLPDTVDAALDRGSPTVASDCKTTAAAVGSSTAYIGTTTVTSARSVVATIPIVGLTPSTDYIVTVKINRYTAGGGSYVDFIYDTIEFTAGATDEDITYDVPVNTDYDYEIDTSYKDIAAA